jgi:hypothetical protein
MSLELSVSEHDSFRLDNVVNAETARLISQRFSCSIKNNRAKLLQSVAVLIVLDEVLIIPVVIAVKLAGEKIM